MKKKAIEKNTIFWFGENQQKKTGKIHRGDRHQDHRTRKASVPRGVPESERVKRHSTGEDRTHKERFWNIPAGIGRVDTPVCPVREQQQWKADLE